MRNQLLMNPCGNQPNKQQLQGSPGAITAALNLQNITAKAAYLLPYCYLEQAMFTEDKRVFL